MSGQERRGKLSGIPHGAPAGLTMWFCFLLAAGVLRFLLEVTGPDRLRTWQIFLVNLLFWSGMAQGALVFAATHEIVQARWGGTWSFPSSALTWR